MNGDAQRHLLRMVDLARAGPHGDQPREDWKRESLSRFGATLEALRAVGAVTQDEMHDWNNRLLIALGIEPLEPLPPGSSGARTIRISDVPPPPVIPNPPARFLRLVPARTPDVAIGFGGRLQVLGIELYDSRVAVAWRLAPLPDPERQFREQLAAHDRDSEGLPEVERRHSRQLLVHRLGHARQHLSLSDDLGTPYHPIGGASGGGRDERTGRAQFQPAVPDAATQLTVSWADEASIPIDLQREG
jgi:hypothetical protein